VLGSDGILSDSDRSLLMSVFVLSSTDSVNALSLSSLILLQGVGGLCSSFGVSFFVGSVGSSNGCDVGRVVCDSFFRFCLTCFICLDLFLDRIDFLVSSFFLILLQLLLSLLK